MLRVRSFPRLQDFGKEESGIKRVVEAYYKYLPQFDVQFVDDPEQAVDITVAHASSYPTPEVVHNHGLYWTGDYQAGNWEWDVNREVIQAVRQAKQVTVPSTWVAEVFQREMKFSPTVVPHGIEWQDWQHSEENQGYVLWNKNRDQDVCTPHWVNLLASTFNKVQFVSTFSASKAPQHNVLVTGIVPHDKMKLMVQRAGVYLSTTKETFGIGILEALASGVPVLGFRYGGNVDLVEHGVTGYLANPGDIDDLKAGLDYCVKHHDILSANARESAKKWSWLAAAEKVAGVYRLASVVEQPTVSVIIPCFNYSDKVGRAIESVLKQTYKKIDKIIVVDDGSTDDTKAVVEKYINTYPNIKYIYQKNSGVANARNAGIASCNSKYTCCLDADDAIQPTFLEVCVDALERDRSLGIAYTGLWYIKPDGSQGVSPWPGDFNYDAQLKGQNQIPTCCVFRRKMWERLCGYDQRYAPGGAGEEDAEFWLRAGAYGFNAKQVTSEPLFVYSWMSGRVSGQRDHVTVDWLSQHPWTKDEQHPFASLAKAKHFSHPVRQYDEPSVSVIIPVGKGHEREVLNALDSLEAQTFRKWEVIVVNDTGLDSIDLPGYPYARVIKTDKRGAGHARNVGVSIARAPFLLFVDADDWLYPTAIDDMLYEWAATGKIIYTDYTGKAIITDPVEVNKLGERLLYYNEKTKEAVIAHKAFEYDCEKAIAQPNKEMYIWSLITSLLPKAWHNEIGGFDENMVSWEDWDYWIRMAKAGKCFQRLAKPLIVYRFHTGNRRERGLHEAQKLIQYLLEKYKGTKTMGCGCSNPPRAQDPIVGLQLGPNGNNGDNNSMLSDDNIILVQYEHPNKGQHRVVGAATGTDYGYRGGGDRFLVDKRDIAAQPSLFVSINTQIRSPEQQIVPTPPPVLQQQAVNVNLIEEQQSAPRLQPGTEFNLQLVPGITAQSAAALNARGVHSLQDIDDFGLDNLMTIKGIGKARAETIIKYVTEHL